MKNEKEIKNEKRRPGRPRKNKVNTPVNCVTTPNCKHENDNEFDSLVDAFNNLKKLEDLVKELDKLNSEEDVEVSNTCKFGDKCKCEQDDEYDICFGLASAICEQCRDARVFEKLITNPDYIEAFTTITEAIEEAKEELETEMNADNATESIFVETFSESPDSEVYKVVVTVENPSEETFEKLIELFPEK